jgi:hypothetical protein
MSMKAFHAKRKEPDDLVTDLLKNVSISPTKKVRVRVSSLFPLDFRLSHYYLVCVLIWNLFSFFFGLLICVFGSDDILVLRFFLPSCCFVSLGFVPVFVLRKTGRPLVSKAVCQETCREVRFPSAVTAASLLSFCHFALPLRFASCLTLWSFCMAAFCLLCI